MKKIISTMAMACLSFSCFAESYFVKIAKDEYVLQHGEKAESLGINKSGFGSVAPVDAVYTPTHIFTYPDGTPSLFRNIQKIEYTESKVTFVKDMKSRKCCIDILDDKEGKNKCRIIGVNGHNIGSFEVYEVADEANSFTDNTPRLIYIDHTGLYIVEKDKNPVEDVSKNYFMNRKFDFKGEIIKISAVDGKVSDKAYETMKFRYAKTEPVYFVAETPIMKQIEKITGVMPAPPPSEEAALKRMAELLGVPEEVLSIQDGVVYVKNAMLKGNNKTGENKTLESYLANGIIIYVGRGCSPYKFDTSDEAKKRRKEIALKPWDE